MRRSYTAIEVSPSLRFTYRVFWGGKQPHIGYWDAVHKGTVVGYVCHAQ